jgi:ABC-type nitrate/sulfonate/bicarbonate transport system permease component
MDIVVPWLVLCAVWEVACRVGSINPEVLPPPSAVGYQFFLMVFKKGTLIHHIASSLGRLFLGYVLAALLGTLAGTILGLNRTLREICSPTLSFLIAVPTIAWVPLLLVTAGLGNVTVVVAVFLGGFFEITMSAMAGARALNRRQLNAARIMGVGGLNLYLQVILPGTLVHVLPALRLSVGYCWRALVGSEMLAAAIGWGLGKMIYDARFWNDASIMLVGLATIGILGALLDRTILQRLEKETLHKWGLVTGS